MVDENTLDQVVQEQLEAAAPSVVEESKEDKVKQNLIAMRKKLEAEEYARKELERQLEEAKRNQMQPQYQHAQNQPEEEEEGDPDDFVPQKALRKTTKKFGSQLSEAQQKLKQMEDKLAYLEAKAELDAIKDFKEVVTDDNIKTFARLYQDDYETVMANPNLKGKAKTLYNMIKNYGITSAAPLLKQAQTIKAVDNKIEANRLKPGAAASAPISHSPLTNASRYNSEGRLILSEEEARRINLETRRKIDGFRV